MLTRTDNQIGTLYNPNTMRVTVSSKTHFYHEITKLRSGGLHISVADLLTPTAGEAWFKEAYELRSQPDGIIVHNVDTGGSASFRYWSPAIQKPYFGSNLVPSKQLIFKSDGSFRDGKIINLKLIVWESQDQLRDWIGWFFRDIPPHKVRENVIYTHSK
jgi:hypothetical protein